MDTAEIGKGIFAFIFGNIFYYLAWFAFKALLDIATSVDNVISTMSWITFILMYLVVCFVYPIYAITLGYRGTGQTRFNRIAKANVYWLVGTIACVLVFMIVQALVGTFVGLTGSITNTGGTNVNYDTSSTLDVTKIISWLLVIVVYVMYLIALPINNLMMGFEVKADEKNN